MLITVNKQVEETVEVSLPAYFKDLFGHFCINKDESVVQVYPAQLTVWRAKSAGAKDAIHTAVKTTPITHEEFECAYRQTMATIEGAHESSLIHQP